MQKIFVFGNEFVAGDEVAKNLAAKINHPDFEFVKAESPNEILSESGVIWIMDVVQGIDKVQILDRIEDLELARSSTCHDLDLGFFLKLMRESGKIDEMRIIGIPFGEQNLKKLKKEVEVLINEQQATNNKQI